MLRADRHSKYFLLRKQNTHQSFVNLYSCFFFLDRKCTSRIYLLGLRTVSSFHQSVKRCICFNFKAQKIIYVFIYNFVAILYNTGPDLNRLHFFSTETRLKFLTNAIDAIELLINNLRNWGSGKRSKRSSRIFLRMFFPSDLSVIIVISCIHAKIPVSNIKAHLMCLLHVNLFH